VRLLGGHSLIKNRCDLPDDFWVFKQLLQHALILQLYLHGLMEDILQVFDLILELSIFLIRFFSLHLEQTTPGL